VDGILTRTTTDIGASAEQQRAGLVSAHDAGFGIVEEVSRNFAARTAWQQQPSAPLAKPLPQAGTMRGQ
jgi:hypothetical protein